jgi:hypothetical protein
MPIYISPFDSYGSAGDNSRIASAGTVNTTVATLIETAYRSNQEILRIAVTCS